MADTNDYSQYKLPSKKNENGEELVQKSDGEWISFADYQGLPPEEKYLKRGVKEDTGEKIGFNPATAEWEFYEDQDWVDSAPLPASVERGVRKGFQGVDYLKRETGLLNDEDYIENVIQSNRKIEEEPLSEVQKQGVTEIYESENPFDFVYNLVSNPSTTGMMLGESAGSMGPGLGAAATFTGVGRIAKAAPWALRTLSGVGAGIGSGSVEASSTFLESLQEQGVDTSTREGLAEGLKNPQIEEIARERAIMKGVPVGTLDAVSMGLAGIPTSSIIAREGLTKASLLKGTGIETVGQAALGATGEAVGSKLSSGEINPVDVGLEAALEGVFAVPEMAFQSAIQPQQEVANKIRPDRQNRRRSRFDLLDKDIEEVPDPVDETPIDSKQAEAEVPQRESLEKKQPDTAKQRAKKNTAISNPILEESEAQVRGFEGLAETTQPDDLKMDQIQKQKKNVANIVKSDNLTVKAFNDDRSFKSLSENLNQRSQGNVKYQQAFHGSPYNFDKFSTDRLGSGQGQQAYGWGLYFTDNKAGANKFRIGLSKDETLGKGQLYEVDIPEDTELLNWDEKIKPSVSEAISNDERVRRSSIVDPETNKVRNNLAGADLYRRLEREVFKGDSEQTSKFLAEKGLKGIKFRDRQARADSAKGNNFVIFDPEAINNVKTFFQRNFEMPEYNGSEVFGANQDWDFQVENARGLTLKDTTKNTSQLKKMKEIENAVKKMVGNNVNVKFFEELREFTGSESSSPVRGLSVGNLIGVALNATNIDAYETGFHEAYHELKRRGLISSDDQKVMDKKRERLKKFVSENTSIPFDDIRNLDMTPEGREELEATAVGLWASKKRENPNYTSKTLTPPLERVFNKVKKFLENFGVNLRQKGITDIEDLFDSLIEGQRASDVIKEGTEQSSKIRWQKIEQTRQDAEQETATESALKLFEKGAQDALERDNTELSGLSWFGRYVSSIPHLASKSKVAASVYNVYRTKEMIQSTLASKFHKDLAEFNALPKEDKESLYELADYLRSTDQSPEFDEDGQLMFIKDGKFVKVKNKEASDRFKDLSNYYNRIRQDTIRALKHNMAERLGISVENFNTTDLDKLIENTKDSTKKETFRNVKESLEEFENMGDKVYVPHLRFGDRGVSVKDKKTGEQVAFYTIERKNKHTGLNKYQYDQVKKDVAEKYSDSSLYKVEGLDNPFYLTRNNISSKIDSSAINIDLLMGLLQSTEVDKEILENVQEQVVNNIFSQGFAKNMMASKGIDGYSRDWVRVHHQYLGSASNFISNMHTNNRLNSVKKVIAENGFSDNNLKNAVESFINYMENPAEDFMKMRMFNFMWTMGGNVSTSLLQLFTLPTLTLGNMNKFEHNPIKHMATQSKWFKIGTQAFPNNVRFEEGAMVTDFSTNVKNLHDKGVLDEDDLKFAKMLEWTGQTYGLSVEEYAGRKQYESRTRTGKIRDMGSVAANTLGIPISSMEQLSRFTTGMSMYQTLKNKSDKEILDVLGNDQRFREFIEADDSMSIQQAAAFYSVDEAHAVFGKVGRAPIYRGLGGALFFPFMTYPHYALESLFRMSTSQGKQGKVGAATVLGSLAVFSGLMGLPGGELLKELYEELHKNVAGEEIDLDLMAREAMYNYTGSDDLGVGITQGIFRGTNTLDVSSRIGLPIPGQDIPLSVLGIRGGDSAMLGVGGGVLTDTIDAWKEYQNDASLGSVMGRMSPVAMANIFKAADWANNGISTRKGYKLLPEDEVSTFTVTMRALGFNSDQKAAATEKKYFADTMGKKYDPFYERQRERAKKAVYRMYEAREEGDSKTASEQLDKFQTIRQEIIQKVAVEGNTPVDLGAFDRSVMKAVLQRMYPEKTFYEHLRKNARKPAQVLEELL